MTTRDKVHSGGSVTLVICEWVMSSPVIGVVSGLLSLKVCAMWSCEEKLDSVVLLDDGVEVCQVVEG